MATITKRKISLSIKYSKDDPGNLIWQARAECAVADDTKEGGEETFSIATDPAIITRAQFRGLTGQQIESQVVSAINDKLQALGSGAGSHTLQDDYGS